MHNVVETVCHVKNLLHLNSLQPHHTTTLPLIYAHVLRLTPTAHTHTEVVEDHGGELTERVETRCGQLVGLLRERGEVVCPLEADRDQVSSVVLSEFEALAVAWSISVSQRVF